MLLGELEEERVQDLALALVERCEELLLELARERAELGQRLPPGRGHLDHVAPAVGRIAAALDQPGRLELVEQADQLAAVVAERVRDRALRLARPFVEHGQDRVVVRMEAELLVGGERPLLRGHPEPLEEEQRGRHELLR